MINKTQRNFPVWGAIWYSGHGFMLCLGRVCYEWRVKK